MKQTYKDEIIEIIKDQTESMFCDDLTEILKWINAHPDRVTSEKQTENITYNEPFMLFKGDNFKDGLSKNDFKERQTTALELRKELEKLEKAFPESFSSSHLMIINISGYEEELGNILNSFNEKKRIFPIINNSLRVTRPCDMKKIVSEIPDIKFLYEYVQNGRKKEREKLYELGREILNEYQILFTDRAS